MDFFGRDLPQGSPQWWAQKLTRAIHDRNRGAGYRTTKFNNARGTRPALKVLDAWMRGEPPLPETFKQDYIDAWQTFLRVSRTNYAELVVSSVSDRLVPLGWRTALDGDGNGDAQAHRIAKETNLVLNAGDAIEDMLTLGDGYLMVGQVEGRPAITREDPFSTIVAASKATGKPRAGLRTLKDEWTGEDEHWLYLPGEQRVARKDKAGKYTFAEAERIPGGRFPIVGLKNRRGVGEFERHLDTLTRINDTLFTRIVLTKLQAHRQHAVEKPAEQDGVEVEYDIDPADFIAGPDVMWDLPPGTKIWESGNTDFGPVRLMVKDDVEALCAVTGTPLADMVPDAANQSAKGSEVVQEKHMSRVLDRQRRVDNALAHVLELAFAVRGAEGDEQRADATQISTIWAPIQRYSLTEKSQAMSQLGDRWPFERLALDVMQVSPGELDELNRLRMQDQIYAPVDTTQDGGADAQQA